MRKLASIQKIWKIEPIEGADFIELVHVLGWQCVTKKGMFHVGDLCVYFEIDSFLPIEPRYEFLRSSSYKKTDLMGEGFKLKTQTFRKQVSQGLVLPMDQFPELEDADVGDDVTAALHVQKYEVPVMATDQGTIIGQLPPSVPKTDEIRIQSMPDLLSEFDDGYYITSKMDGSSHSVSIDVEGNFHVTGHNYEYADDGKSSFYRYVKQHSLEDKMREFMKITDISVLTVQGEWCGGKIQGNPIGLQYPEWYAFTVIIDGKRTDYSMMKFVIHQLGVQCVPVEELKLGPLQNHYHTVDDLLKRAEGNYSTGRRKEGIVIRPIDPKLSKLTGRYLSVKVINNKYLLKEK